MGNKMRNWQMSETDIHPSPDILNQVTSPSALMRSNFPSSPAQILPGLAIGNPFSAGAANPWVHWGNLSSPPSPENQQCWQKGSYLKPQTSKMQLLPRKGNSMDASPIFARNTGLPLCWAPLNFTQVKPALPRSAPLAPPPGPLWIGWFKYEDLAGTHRPLR